MAELGDTSAAQQQYPNLNPYQNTNGTTSNGSTMSNMQAQANGAMDSLKNGPVADKARAEANKTSSEFSNLAGARQTPSTTTATGQNLTHYHSFFYNLLSWENPRATAISYAAIVIFIFATRYMPLVRYGLKALWMVLGITAAAEIAGKSVMGQGVASKMRPKRYYTLPKEWLETIMDDATELINFFVIEFQRIVFAENVLVTVGAFLTTLITYFLIKITPAWGLALLGTTVAFFTPLVYIKNKDLIDGQLDQASDIISKQTQQAREIAGQHTSKASSYAQGAFKDYSAKAGELIGSAKKTAVDKGVVSPQTAGVKTESDFPAAPSSEPSVAAPSTGDKEPLLA